MADLAQEVVQEAQRARIAGLAVDDARERAAEARAGQAEAAVQAAQAGLAQGAAALDDAQARADARERAADERNHLADARDQAADERDRAADEQVSSQTRKTEQRLPGHASASACPATRAAHRLAGRATVSCWLRPTLQRPLTSGQQAATAPNYRYSTSSRVTRAQAGC